MASDYRSTGSNNKYGAKCGNNMRLFGLPYQFIKSVDPRITAVSDEIGTNFVEKIITEAPTVIFIPGRAKFLPGTKNKVGTGHALLEAANGNIEPLLGSNSKDKLRYYDFEERYTEYMNYLNLMCRTVATFLELTERIQTSNGSTSFQSYDWRNYRWNAPYYTSGAGSIISHAWSSSISTIVNLPSAIKAGLKGDKVSNISTKYNNEPEESPKIVGTNNFVQFYVDPSSGASQSMSNVTSQSQIKAAMDNASSLVKEFQFVTNASGAESLGLDKLETLTENGLDALASSFGEGGGLSTVLNQIFSAGSSVVKGENIILPDVYQSSEYGIDYTVDIHLKSPYGNKYSVYMDVIVPLLHLIALCVPKQGSSNTYGSPFLIKAYYPGVFNCNLGIVESLQITKPTSDDAYSVDGLPTEIDVQLRIKDLYSDLTMSPAKDVSLFRNNTSLIDYLATISGLDLIKPQMESKISMLVANYAAAVRDIDDNAVSLVMDKIEKTFAGFTSL